MHTVVTDAEISALALGLGWVIKLILKPSRAEVNLIMNILIWVSSIIFALLKKINHDHKNHIADISTQISNLKSKMRNKTILG